MTDLTQPPLPDMPETPDKSGEHMSELFAQMVSDESDKDIAAIVAGLLLEIRSELDEVKRQVRAVVTHLHNYTTIDISRKEELSQRINSLSERHDQFFSRLNERIDGLRDAVQFVGEQQQYVTDEADRAKAEFKELTANLMANPGKVLKAFMGGSFMGGRKNRAAIAADPTEEMSNNDAG